MKETGIMIFLLQLADFSLSRYNAFQNVNVYNSDINGILEHQHPWTALT